MARKRCRIGFSARTIWHARPRAPLTPDKSSRGVVRTENVDLDLLICDECCGCVWVVLGWVVRGGCVSGGLCGLGVDACARGGVRIGHGWVEWVRRLSCVADDGGPKKTCVQRRRRRLMGLTKCSHRASKRLWKVVCWVWMAPRTATIQFTTTFSCRPL